MKKKHLLKLILLLFLILICFAYSYSEQNNSFSEEAKKFFMEIATGSEYGSELTMIKKWADDIYIYVDGDKVPYLMAELSKVVDELNELITEIEIKLTNSKTKSNFTIYFGPGEDYARNIEPLSAPYVKNNWGLFWCKWDKNYEIQNSTMYVDYKTAEKEYTQISARHILREELTQSLGLMNESVTYRSSIFYANWSTTTAYNRIDREIIQMLYSKNIKAGMNKDEVIQALKSM